MLDRMPRRSGTLAVHFEFAVRTGVKGPNCVGLQGQKMVGILLAKLLDGQPACFVRSEGEFFIVSVNGQERTISRDAWRLLPEQPARERDGVRALGHDQAPHHGGVR